jgi:hypothetical protein
MLRSALPGQRKRAPDAEDVGWGCFAVLWSVGGLLLACTAWVWFGTERSANALASLIMAIFAAPFAAVGLYRIGKRVFSPRGADPAAPGAEEPAGPVRLEDTRPTVGGVVLLWSVTLFWNVPTAVAAVGAVQLGLKGHSAAGLLVFVALYALAGLGLIVLAAWLTLEQFPRLRGLPGEVQVEISSHPLRPGGTCEIEVVVPGPVHLRSLEVLLVCEATRHLADDSGELYEKVETPFRVELLHEEALAIEQAGHTVRLPASLPPDACPSQPPLVGVRPGPGELGAVRWKLVVRGQREGWFLGFDLEFPLTVAAPA